MLCRVCPLLSANRKARETNSHSSLRSGRATFFDGAAPRNMIMCQYDPICAPLIGVPGRQERKPEVHQGRARSGSEIEDGCGEQTKTKRNITLMILHMHAKLSRLPIFSMTAKLNQRLVFPPCTCCNTLIQSHTYVKRNETVTSVTCGHFQVLKHFERLCRF